MFVLGSLSLFVKLVYGFSIFGKQFGGVQRRHIHGQIEAGQDIDHGFVDVLNWLAFAARTDPGEVHEPEESFRIVAKSGVG